jgi:hypothetical protein
MGVVHVYERMSADHPLDKLISNGLLSEIATDDLIKTRR